ncbi:Ferritin protein [Raphanus sativus]|nr:Ferritin protein [Raphanus sativus]
MSLVVAVLICSLESSLHLQVLLTSGSISQPWRTIDSHHLFLLSPISNLNFKTSFPNQLIIISFLHCFVGENLSFSVCASTQPINGIVFKQFVEVKKELDLVPSSLKLSLAQHMYSLKCEAALNEQFFQGLECGRKRPR